MSELTPAQAGYYFPAEFALHTSTWLSWPHNPGTWPGKIETVYKPYSEFIKILVAGEYVNINVADALMENSAKQILQSHDVPLERVKFFYHPTNDAWCRDHGPAFLINPDSRQPKVIVNWKYNAWGEKYPPHDLDDNIPALIGNALNLPVYRPGIVMEGGSVDFNGEGALITSTSCLLNPNRNPHLSKIEIEEYLCNYYGVEQILWVDEGIVGDDTDGHIDDTVRFFNSDSVLTVIEHNRQDENFSLLKHNLKQLQNMQLLNGRNLNVVEIPMPDPVYFNDQRLPASYANFYISNLHVIVPTFRSKRDDEALGIIQQCFPERTVVGIDSTDLIWGLGSFHCLSQQEPAV